MTHPVLYREIDYTDADGTHLIGYFAYPEGAQHRPLVLVCPEWWGRNDYIERRARELAEHGYAAFALDMYGNKTLADTAEQANALMSATFEDNRIIKRATVALATACAQPEADSSRVAAIGFCYGGKVALDLARSGADLQLVATFHGNLSTDIPARADQFKPQVIVAHGEADTMVTLDAVEAFQQEMHAANVVHEIDIYEGARHGFTNPQADANAKKNDIDLGYDEAAEQQSMQKLYSALAELLGTL